MFLSIVFTVLGFLVAFAGLVTLAEAKAIFQQILGLVFWVIAAIFLAAGALLGKMHALHNALKKQALPKDEAA